MFKTFKCFFKKNAELLIISIFLAASLHIIIYTYWFAFPFVRSDGWRFIKIYLIPLWNGSFTLKDLWIDVHPWPLSAIFFILNAKIFNLNFRYEALFGVFFQILFAGVLFHQFKKSLNKTSFFYFIPIIVIIFSLKSPIEYTWSLVTILEIDYFLVFLFIGWVSDSLRHSSFSFPKTALSLAFFVFVLACDFDTIIIFGAALLFSLGIVWLAEKNLRRPLTYLISGIMIDVVFYKWILGVFLGYFLTQSPAYLGPLKEPRFVISSLLQNIGSALVNFSNQGNMLLYCFSAGMFIFYLLAIYLYIRHKMYSITLVPLVMVFFQLFLALALQVFRPTQIGAPRYTSMYQIGIIGVIWIFVLYFERFQHALLLRKGFILTLSLICLTQVSYIQKGWGFGFSVDKSSLKYVQALYRIQDTQSMKNISLDKSFKGGFFSIEALNFLYKNKLNLFSDKMYNLYKKNEPPMN